MESKIPIILPIALIAVGTGWLLSTLGVAPDINWIWTIALAAIGLLTFLTSGVDKFSVVVGPIFLVASCLSVLRQSGRIAMDTEVPILVVLLGVLMLVARMKKIPQPRWMEEISIESE